MVLQLYQDELGEYWEPERKLVEELYRGVRLPFSEILAPALNIAAVWGLEDLVGYLSTGSAFQTLHSKEAR